MHLNENLLSQNIIRYRKAAGLTQEKLGKRFERQHRRVI